MTISHENYGHVTVLSLKGEFTADDAENFQRVVKDRLANDVHDFVIDLEKVPFVDSAALEAMLDLRDQSQEKVGAVKLAAADENVTKILEMTRLDQQFERFGDLIEAVKSFR
ncbi:MAG: STAS domain-containing protein [Phycisphaerae bacterium]|nr:STAS domain-containing protein [Phycisphaerae bacterium]